MEYRTKKSRLDSNDYADIERNVKDGKILAAIALGGIAIKKIPWEKVGKIVIKNIGKIRI